MKSFYYLCFALFLVWSCASKNAMVKQTNNHKNDVVRIANDSLKYEITIIDIRFHNYLETIAKPMSFYSIDYLENKNKFYVSKWNDRVRNAYKPNLYENIIDYDYNIHYGLEVNYKLYNYFKFVEKEYGEKF